VKFVFRNLIGRWSYYQKGINLGIRKMDHCKIQDERDKQQDFYREEVHISKSFGIVWKCKINTPIRSSYPLITDWLKKSPITK
jgi:hypothetical protein